MLRPLRMSRVEVLVHENYLDAVLRYLRELNAVELIDVKEIARGYEGIVNPSPLSEKLYKYTSLASKINSLISILKVPAGSVKPMKVKEILSEEEFDKINGEVSAIESKCASIVNQIQTLEQLLSFVEDEFDKLIEEIMKIRDVDTPEGRHKLEEAMDQIFSSLKPSEMDEVKSIAKRLKTEEVEYAIKKSITDEIAKLLTRKRSVSTIRRALSRAFDLENRVKKAKSQLKELNNQLAAISEENGEKLLAYQELVNAERVVEEARGLSGRTETTYIIEGLTPSERIEELRDGVLAASNKLCVFRSWPAKEGPTKLKNPSLTAVFERLTQGFGIPSYNDVDPTVFWVITFPLFFGLMFGDVGHGLILLIGALALYYLKKRGVRVEVMGGLLNMIMDGAPLLIMCGISSTICGFLYGTVLGSEEWFNLITGLHGPIWFSPWHQPIFLLKVSIIIGMIHISLGLLLNAVNKFAHREFKELIIGPASWLWFYWTMCYLLLKYRFGIINYLMTYQGLALLAAPAVFMLASRSIAEGFMEGFGSTLESVLASISHTISYARILALKIIHDAFSSLFLAILAACVAANSILMAAIGVFTFSILTFLMIMCFETLFVFLHSLRLHWVEWFLKFYEGTGTEFKPYGIRRAYTALTPV